MAPYHHMLAHFPVALLSLAFLLILFRGLIDNESSRRLDSTALMPCLLLGIAGGLAALVSGLMIWPAEGTLTSTMGRNKVLIATWTIAVWGLVFLLRWRGGEATWKGAGRWIILAFSALGVILLATTGTLGGHLLGSPSRFSSVLHQFGWSVYQTFLAPDWVLGIMTAVGLAGIVTGMIFGRRNAS